MPRYYFNTRIGDELISDPDGEVLRDPDRAWEMARAMIRELLKTDGADGALLSATIEVTDDDGEIVLEFPFAEAILDAPGGPRSRGTDARTPSRRAFPFVQLRLTHVSDCASARKISETAVPESHRRRHHVGARAEKRLPPRENAHDKSFVGAAQPVAGRCILQCIHTERRCPAARRASPPPAQRLRPRPRFRRGRR